ncbi:MAG: outer membrane protein assembly factor BamD [Nitratireductor sp.]
MRIEVAGNRKRNAVNAALHVGAMTAVLFLAGCNSNGTSSNDFVDNIEPADRLPIRRLPISMAALSRKRARRLKKSTRKHPYSEYSRKAMVLQTFLHYRKGEYDDAVNMGKRYVALYPGDKDAAYAQYLIGMSYFRQIPDITRDQTITARSYSAFNQVVERYPDSEYVEDSRAKIRVTLDQLAGKEMLTGRYYLERREYLAAINRFRNVVEKFQTTRHIEEALARLTESYYAMGIVDEAQTAAAVLGHNFPESQWYKDSVKLLKSGGQEPRENTNSWISKLFAAKATG